MSEEMEKLKKEIQNRRKGVVERAWSDQSLEKKAKDGLQDAEEALRAQSFAEVKRHLAGIDFIFKKDKVRGEIEESKQKVAGHSWYHAFHQRKAEEHLGLAERALEARLLNIAKGHITEVEAIRDDDGRARKQYEGEQGCQEAKKTQTKLVSQLKEAGMSSLPFRAVYEGERWWWGWLDNYDHTLFWGIRGWLYFIPLFGPHVYGRFFNFFNRGRRHFLDSRAYRGSSLLFDAVEKLREMDIPDKRLFVFTRKVRAGIDPVLAVQVEEGDQDRYVCVLRWD